LRAVRYATRWSLLIAALLMLASSAAAQDRGGQVLRLRVAPQGNEARYRVREQLMNIDFPGDAIGKTSKVDGHIAVDSKGAVLEGSRFTIDLASLTSDKEMRDNFIRRRTLQTEQYATATFVPTEIKNLKLPLPKSGEVKFQMVGNLTVRTVTKPVTWEVVAKVDNGALTGEAKTRFTFAEFELDKPRVRSVLSVEDDITLEYTFMLVPAT
jgi:polyisoprenoid-binding protein YceI